MVHKFSKHLTKNFSVDAKNTGTATTANGHRNDYYNYNYEYYSTEGSAEASDTTSESNITTEAG